MNVRWVIPLILLLGSAPEMTQAQSWNSALLRFDSNGRLEYAADPLGNRLPDFSYAGYRNGNEPVPFIPDVLTIGPVPGDNTAHIQAAIDSVAKRPIGPDGFRGALRLLPGVYRIFGTVRVNQSGIVLRGAGQGNDSTANTILFALGDTPHQRSVIVAGGGTTSRWKEKDPAVTAQNIVTDTVRTGERSFTVADASQFSVGDNIIIHHPCTEAWLAAIDFGGSHTGEPGADSVDVPWKKDSYPIYYNRNITAKTGNTLTVDVPLFYTLVRSLSQSVIYKYARTNLRTRIGIENLRVDIDAGDVTSNANGNENHAWNAVELNTVEDAWVRDCTMLHFGHAGVITNTTTRATVERVSALDPVSIITGERRYNFNTYTASQQVLFRECIATNGRHHYVSNGTTYASGNVFVDCTSKGAYASSEGHRSWSQGFLWDNHTELDGPRSGVKILLGLYNRGYYGTSHGWAIVNSVAWNCDVRTAALIVQRPPTAQNFAIGCTGEVTGARPPAPFAHPDGFIEGTGKDSLQPRSLYYAQLEDRKRLSGLRGESAAPDEFRLFQNYPNPFNPSTTIAFLVPATASTTALALKVYDLLGREVMTLAEGDRSPGRHTVSFEAAALPSGAYFYRLESARFSATAKMLLLR